MYKFIIIFIMCLIFLGCAGGQQTSISANESAPCSDCRSGEEINFDIKVNKSYRESKYEKLVPDSGAVIGVLPALNVVASAPENCSYCHSFSESAIEFDFAAKEDSILRSYFPNNELTLLYPGAQIPEKDSLEFKKAFENLKEIPLSENKELKLFLKEISKRYKVRYLAFASYIEVNIKDKRTFEWESEWSLWDATKGELLLWDYQALEVKNKNFAPIDRGWANCWKF